MKLEEGPSEGMDKPWEGRGRVVIENVQPVVDCGRFPIKRVVGDRVSVEADVFADGHDRVRAWLLWRPWSESDWRTESMASLGNDRWRAEFPVDSMGRFLYTVAGEVDRFATWRDDLRKRAAAGQDLGIPFQTGARLLRELGPLAQASDVVLLRAWASQLDLSGRAEAPEGEVSTTLELILGDEVAAVMARLPGGPWVTELSPPLAVEVDRERARFSAWYELFPRSWSNTSGQHGTFRDVASNLDYVADMGFDVLYLPPIHPIGHSFRKGKNNAEEAAPGDVGSPWAIGSSEGGHTAIEANLGSFEDFEFLRREAEARGIEIALDIAFQCSPDHPWVTEHPGFFKKRPDGSIQYAENPPKKYQDIYPLDFESSEWKQLWHELKAVFVFWAEKGVRIFRVDNPHTKSFPFWEWVIGELKAEYPDLIFLAEAFTRPHVMQRLAKLGFTQSYTYFTWRNTKEELTDYVLELTESPMKEYFRANFWPNTPDILHAILQKGGLPAFKSRLVLAGTLASNYGIYGPAFELAENIPLKEGSEEYLNSEKYQIREWNLESPFSLKPLITRLNRARRENPALQSNDGVHFHRTDNPFLICYSKRSLDGGNAILAVVNMDPHHIQSGWVYLDMGFLGLAWDESFEVNGLLMDRRYTWRGSRNYVELRPDDVPAHLFRIGRLPGKNA